MSGAILAYSGVTLVSFDFIAVSFRLVPVYSGTILVHSVSFRRHSASFRYIPVYSVPFRSVPVFSNAPLSMSLESNETKRGPGFWKFNNSLLMDKCYTEMMIKQIPEFINKYCNLNNKDILLEHQH